MTDSFGVSDAGVSAPAPYGGYGASAPPVDGVPVDGVDMWGVLAALWARKWVVAGTTLAAMVMAALILASTKPSYRAEAKIILENNDALFRTAASGAAGVDVFDVQAIFSQIQVVQSVEIARQVISEFQFDRYPEFNTLLAGRSFFDSVAVIFGLGSSPGGAEQVQSIILKNYYKNLLAYRVLESGVIGIVFESRDPRLAAAVANRVAALYINFQKRQRVSVNRSATGAFEREIKKLQEKVMVSEVKVSAYKNKIGFLEGDNASLGAQGLSQLNRQLILAENSKTEAQARASIIRNRLFGGGEISAIPEVLASPLIQRLREGQVRLQTQIAELSVAYLETHPRMIQLHAELQDLDVQIEAEVYKIADSLESEAQVAGVQAAAIRGNLNRLKAREQITTRQLGQLRSLESEVAANRRILETFLTSYSVTSARDDLQAQPGIAHIISEALVPNTPSSPKKGAVLTLSGLAGFILGLVIVGILEISGKGFRTVAAVEQLTGTPVIGMVPLLRGRFGGGEARPQTEMIARPNSAYTRALRALCDQIQMTQGRTGAKKLLMVSAEPDDGKTTLVVGLARVMAMSGRRVLVIDADLRRPSVHRMFGMVAWGGLNELLSGTVSFGSVVVKDQMTGVDVVQAGQPMTNPLALFNSNRFDILLDKVSVHYDIILIDSPPVSAISDTRLLTEKADITVFALRWNHTERRTVMQALDVIASTSGRRAGVVMTHVDTRRCAMPDKAYHYCPA